MLHPTLERVRLISDDVLNDMIKARLTSILDVESEFDYDQINKKGSHSYSGTIFGANLTQEGICSINQLIDHITMKNNIIQEGIFRKSGSLLRQNELQNNLCQGKTIVIDEKFTVHDSCCVLKKFISEIPQPLLSSALRSLWLQTNEFRNSSQTVKQLNAVRLLLLLLPTANRIFLGDLMRMFNKVLEHSEQNRMTSQSLATIFASHLFLARDVKPERVCQLLKSISECLVFMIENSEEIFNPPPDLLRDAQIYLDKREQVNQFMSTTSLRAIPYSKLCATTADSYAPKDYTELQLAELYAQVQSMNASSTTPSATKKSLTGSKSTKTNKKLIKKFNKQNGFGTPMLTVHKEQQELIKESMKRSANGNINNRKKNQFRLIGSAIKKKCLMSLTPNADRTLRSSPLSNCSKRKSTSSSLNQSVTLCGTSLMNSVQSLDQLKNNRCTTMEQSPLNISKLSETPKSATLVCRKSSSNSSSTSSRLKLSGNSPLKQRASLISLKNRILESSASASISPDIVAAAIINSNHCLASPTQQQQQQPVRCSIRRNGYVNLRPSSIRKNGGRPLPPLPSTTMSPMASNTTGNHNENKTICLDKLRRKSSLYSINEDILSNITNNKNNVVVVVSNQNKNPSFKSSNISTRSLPAASTTNSNLNSNQRKIMTSSTITSRPYLDAELELIPKKVKKLAAKYESLPKKILVGPGHEDSSSDDDESGDYVCLSSIPIRSELFAKYSKSKTQNNNINNRSAVTISSWPKLNTNNQQINVTRTKTPLSKPTLSSASFNSISASGGGRQMLTRSTKVVQSASFKLSSTTATPMRTRLPIIDRSGGLRSHRKATLIVDRHTAL